MWLLGDGQRGQKGQLEDRSVSYLLSSMSDLNLNYRSSRASEVHTDSLSLSHTHIDSWCVCPTGSGD